MMLLRKCELKFIRSVLLVVLLSLVLLVAAVMPLVSASSSVVFNSSGVISYSSYMINALSPNFGWIQSDWWSSDGGIPYCLQNNLTYIVNRCADNGINIVNIFVGTYDGNAFYNWTQMPDSFWRIVIDAFHAKGIKCYAWVEDAGSDTKPNVAPANYPAFYEIIENVLAVGWDGYNDDIEDLDVMNSTSLANWCNYSNNMTIFTHSLGKNYSTCAGYDWTRQLNQRLHVDYIQVMLYGSVSLLEDPQIDAYWISEFATQSASPIAIGIMNYYGNQYRLGYQLNQVTRLLASYPHNNLVAFGLWLADDMTPADWETWNYWLNNLNPPDPVANIVTFNTSPTILATSIINGVNSSMPSQAYAYSSQVLNVSVTPTAINYDYSGVLFGDTTIGRGDGSAYSIYEYCSGENTITTQVSGNKCFFYSATAGYVKLALYDSVVKNVSGFPDNRNYPNNLLAQSAPTLCHIGWNEVVLNQTVTVPAGIYFISVKISVSGMICFGSSQMCAGVWKSADYPTTDFTSSFGDPASATGGRIAVYFGSAAPVVTTYYFNHWNDGITTNSRQISASTTTTYTAYYTTTPSG